MMRYTQFTQLSSYSDALETTQLAFSILLLWNPSDTASETRREDVPLSTAYPGIFMTKKKKKKKGNQKRNSLSRSLLFQIYHLASILFCRTWLTLIFLFNFLLYYHRSVSVMGPKHFLPPSTIAVMLESSCMWSD